MVIFRHIILSVCTEREEVIEYTMRKVKELILIWTFNIPARLLLVVIVIMFLVFVSKHVSFLIYDEYKLFNCKGIFMSWYSVGIC